MAGTETATGAPWAVILGASSGFGAATSRELAAAGFNICGVHLDRRSTLPQAEAVIADVQAAGREAAFFNVNAADPEKRAEARAAGLDLEPLALQDLFVHLTEPRGDQS